MRTNNILRCSLLAALVAVSLAAPTSSEDTTPDTDLNDELQAFFEKNPAIARDLYPDLVDKASDVSITVDQDDVLNLLRGYMKDRAVEEIEEALENEDELNNQEEEDEEDEESEEDVDGSYIRRKRQTSILGGFEQNKNPFGSSTSGSLGINRSWDNGRHSLTGSISGSKQTINGLGSSRSFGAGVGYNFTPNKRTSFGINAHTNRTPGGGRSHGFGLNFRHTFGR